MAAMSERYLVRANIVYVPPYASSVVQGARVVSQHSTPEEAETIVAALNERFLGSCCLPQMLCWRCLPRERKEKMPMARTIGICWAELVARRFARWRARESWPTETETAARFARAKVQHLARDPRLLAELLAACLAGAELWWLQRPGQYRMDGR